MRSPSHWLTAAYGTQRSDAPSGLVAPERRAVPQGPGAQAVVPLGVRDSGTFARQRKRPVPRFSETSLSLGSARLQWPSRESKTPLVVTPTEWASQRDRESRLPEEEGHALLVGMTNDARGRRGEAAEGTGPQRCWLPRPALPCWAPVRSLFSRSPLLCLTFPKPATQSWGSSEKESQQPRPVSGVHSTRPPAAVGRALGDSP